MKAQSRFSACTPAKTRRLIVSIANTEIQLLELLRDNVKCGKITRKRIESGLHTPSLGVSVSSRQALELLRQIAPFLKSFKRKRADLAMELYISLTPRNGKCTRSQLARRKQFEQAFLAELPATRIGAKTAAQ